MAATAGINWEALLGADPSLAAAVNNYQTQDPLNQAARRTSQYQSLIGYGAAPDLEALYNQNPEGFRALYGGTPAELVPGSVSQAAQQATEGGISTLAQLQHNYQLAQQGVASNLAERGILHSGGYLSGSNANLQARNVAQAQAAQNVLGQLAQAYQTYLGQKQGLVSDQQKALDTATQRIYDQINAGTLANPSGVAAAMKASTAAPRSKPVGQTAVARAASQGAAGYYTPPANVGVTTPASMGASANAAIRAGYVTPTPPTINPTARIQ